MTPVGQLLPTASATVMCRSRAPWIAVLVVLVLPCFASPAEKVAFNGPDAQSFAIEGLSPWSADEPRPVEIQDAHWFHFKKGWIVVAEPCSALIAAREMQAAADAFKRHFGAPVISGAILDAALGVRAAELRDAGAGWAMSWRFPDPDGEDALTEPEAEMAAKLEADGQDRASARLAARLWGATQGSSGHKARKPPAGPPDILRHEIAHELFIHGVWPRPESGARYGGGAPDWLDEAAATLADSESRTRNRRDKFRSLARDNELIPLSEYFSMEHPLYASPELLRKIREASKNVRPGEPIVVNTEPDEDENLRSRAFYPQTRGTIDFLLERSDKPRILMMITRALKDGKTFEEWLAETGPANGLPTELDELDRTFREWAVSGGGYDSYIESDSD